MIKVVKIEDFVIKQLFLPYSTSIHGIDGWHESITEDRKYKYILSKNPEKIIEMSDEKEVYVSKLSIAFIM